MTTDRGNKMKAYATIYGNSLSVFFNSIEEALSCLSDRDEIPLIEIEYDPENAKIYTRTKMNKFEKHACNQVFHNYPEKMSFADIKALCLNDKLREAHNKSLEHTREEDQQIYLYVEYEHKSWDSIPVILEEIKDSVQREFG